MLLPSTETRSCSGSIFFPNLETMSPLTETHPSTMICSAARRDARPCPAGAERRQRSGSGRSASTRRPGRQRVHRRLVQVAGARHPDRRDPGERGPSRRARRCAARHRTNSRARGVQAVGNSCCGCARRGRARHGDRSPHRPARLFERARRRHRRAAPEGAGGAPKSAERPPGRATAAERCRHAAQGRGGPTQHRVERRPEPATPRVGDRRPCGWRAGIVQLRAAAG